MELYQLKSFAAVAELGHLTRAADRLHISQPALSAQIKALEDELGVALFDRGSSGMALTAAGRRLLPESQKVMAAAQVLRSQASALKGEVAGRVRVGTVSDPGFIRVGDLLVQAIEAFPLLEIELHHEVSGAAFEKVRDGALDASFYYGSLTHPTVATLPLCDFAYRVVAPVAWAARVEDAGWDEIVAMPWIMTPAISTHHALASKLFSEYGVSPARRVEADNEAVISSLVIAGLGVTLMREDLATEAAEAGEVVLWGDRRLETTLSFVYRAEREEDAVVHALLDVLRRVWHLPFESLPT
ncbi:MAG TPA: LysR family transcriptional regulator [Casimicrobiaceae bacterium]